MVCSISQITDQGIVICLQTFPKPSRGGIGRDQPCMRSSSLLSDLKPGKGSSVVKMQIVSDI